MGKGRPSKLARGERDPMSSRLAHLRESRQAHNSHI
jgi:hypothetical protein